MIPMKPHVVICQIAHIPIPSIIFDKNVTKIAIITPAKGPSKTPVIIIIAVTGWTFGINTKNTLPTTATAANIANNVNLYVFTMNQLFPTL